MRSALAPANSIDPQDLFDPNCPPQENRPPRRRPFVPPILMCSSLRWFFVVGALGLAADAAKAAPDSVVTINEVCYHPADPAPPSATTAPEWIELHNQMSIRVDLGGWSLRGGVAFTFPEGTVMEPGSYLLVSSLAGSPAAALGPLVGKLDNAGETVSLHSRWGRLMDRLSYADSGAWPTSPDGAGPTLAKRHSDDGSEAASSWAASSQVGGTPGALNFPVPTEVSPRLLFTLGGSWKCEASGADPGPLWVDPDNFSDAAWSNGSAPLSSAATPAPLTLLPPGRPAYYFRKSFAWTGTMPNPRLLLAGSLKGSIACYFNGTLVATTATSSPAALAVSAANLRTGANLIAIKLSPAPDSPDISLDLAASLLDGTTAVAPALDAPLPGPVVINEISYHARPTFADPAAAIAFAERPAAWIELHNPSAKAADLSGWRLSDAVSYAFPPGTSLAPGAFLTVNNAQFTGALSHRGERLRLRDAANALVDEVPYLDGGRWPEAADAGGSTLELRDPRADRRSPESWAASPEASRSTWQTISYRATGAEPTGTNYPSQWHEFLLGFLDAGEALVDDISVIEDPSGARLQLIQNGSFEGDAVGPTAAKWRLLGTHKESRVELDPDGPGRVLHLVATAAAEHTYNIASTTLTGNRALNPAKTYDISFRAKWLSGSPQLNSRLYFNRAARTTILSQPSQSGTPGAPNASLLSNIGPAGDGLRHSPLVPANFQPVRLSLSLADPDGLGQVTLNYSVNQGPWQRTAMGGDGDGRYFGVIPGQSGGSQVQFYVQALDRAGAAALFPPAGPASRAIYKVGDGGLSTQTVRNKMRLLMTTSDAASLHNPIHSVSNARWPATVIYNDREVWYDAAVRLRSAPYGRQGNRAGWNIQFGPEHPFRGVQTSVVVDGAFNMPKGDGTGWLENSLGPSVNEMLYQAIANRAGDIPATYDDVIYFQTPRTAEGNRRAQLKMTRFNPSFLEEAFTDGADGTLYKQELIYYPTTTVDGNPESLKNAYTSVLDTEIRNMGPSKEGYRWNYLVQNKADRDDFARLMALGQAFDASSANLYAATAAVMDADNWMRVFALTALTGLADTYNNGLAHNIELYVRPSDQKVLLFPWDQDHTFYLSTSSSIFGAGSHRLGAIINLPQNRRLFGGHLRHLCQTAFTNAHLDPIINHLSSSIVADRASYATTLRNWVSARRSYVLSQINVQFPAAAFAVTTNGGAPITTAQPSATISGTGWINVKTILVSRNGAPPQAAPLSWLSGQSWQLILPVTSGPNDFILTALDHDGAAVGSDTLTITNTGAAEPAAPSNLAISEINYHPANPAAEEFIELRNIGTLPIDLTGVQFTEGVQFTFSGTLPVGQRLLLVENRAAFTARYGAALPVAGEFDPGTRLSNDGDHLVLRDRAKAVIAAFSFGDQLPWPPEADGMGRTLTLIRPEGRPDPSLPAHWRPSRQLGGSPGTDDTLSADAFPNLQDYAFTTLPHLTIAPDGDLFLHWSQRLGADAVRLQSETSPDLKTWTPMPEASLVIQSAESAAGERHLAAPFPFAVQGAYVRFRLSPP